MKVLLIKTSSLGDIIHTFPALTDAQAAHPKIEIDWVVEESFAELPHWHPSVVKTIPVAIRRWRKSPLAWWQEWPTIKQALSEKTYDAVIDAQGLLKSAWLTRFTKGPRHGLAKNSARESLASYFYQHHHQVAKNQHAIARTRELIAKSLNYPPPTSNINCNLKIPSTSLPLTIKSPSIILIHGTTWTTKKWPIAHWKTLAKQLNDNNFHIYCPWGTPQEKKGAEQICSHIQNAHCLPKMNLQQIATCLQSATGIITVDSGLAHLSAAIEKPLIALYGATDPIKTGTKSQKQKILTSNFPCSPCLAKKCTYKGPSKHTPACMNELAPQTVFNELVTLLNT